MHQTLAWELEEAGLPWHLRKQAKCIATRISLSLSPEYKVPNARFLQALSSLRTPTHSHRPHLNKSLLPPLRPSTPSSWTSSPMHRRQALHPTLLWPPSLRAIIRSSFSIKRKKNMSIIVLSTIKLVLMITCCIKTMLCREQIIVLLSARLSSNNKI